MTDSNVIAPESQDKGEQVGSADVPWRVLYFGLGDRQWLKAKPSSVYDPSGYLDAIRAYAGRRRCLFPGDCVKLQHRTASGRWRTELSDYRPRKRAEEAGNG